MCWSCEEKKKTSLPLVFFEVEDEAVAVAVLFQSGRDGEDETVFRIWHYLRLGVQLMLLVTHQLEIQTVILVFG